MESATVPSQSKRYAWNSPGGTGSLKTTYQFTFA
jgi:hypothetical protein